MIFSWNSRLLDYDYMVITVSGRFSYNDNVKAIPIPAPTNRELPNNTNCETSGFGYWQKNGNTPTQIAPTLQYTALKCITIDECKKVWRGQTLTGRQQCAEQVGPRKFLSEMEKRQAPNYTSLTSPGTYNLANFEGFYAKYLS